MLKGERYLGLRVERATSEIGDRKKPGGWNFGFLEVSRSRTCGQIFDVSDWQSVQ